MYEHDYGLDPQGRLRLPGIYSATVVAINDPLKKNRIKVAIHQTTGNEITNWAEACLPVTSNAIHPDHTAHTAADVAALLTTTSVVISGSDPQGGSVSSRVPALNIVAKNSKTLTHPHVATTDTQETDTKDEHTAHRILPKMGQLVWVMFVAGDPNYPVWIGVQS